MEEYGIAVYKDNYMTKCLDINSLAALVLYGDFPSIEKYYHEPISLMMYQDYIKDNYFKRAGHNTFNYMPTDEIKSDLYKERGKLAKELTYIYRHYADSKSQYRVLQVIYQLYMKKIFTDLDLSLILRESLLDVGFNSYNRLTDFIVRTNPNLIDDMKFIYDNKLVDIYEYLYLMHDIHGIDRLTDIKIRNLELNDEEKVVVKKELLKNKEKYTRK